MSSSFGSFRLAFAGSTVRRQSRELAGGDFRVGAVVQSVAGADVGVLRVSGRDQPVGVTRLLFHVVGDHFADVVAVRRGDFASHGSDFVYHRVRIHIVLPTGSSVSS